MFNPFETLGSVKNGLDNINKVQGTASKSVKGEMFSLKNTAFQMIKGYELYGLSEGLKSAAEFASNSKTGLTSPYDSLQPFNKDIVQEVTTIGSSVEERKLHKGYQIPLPNVVPQSTENPVPSIIPVAAQPQNLYQENYNRVLNRTKEEIEKGEGNYDLFGALRATATKVGSSVSSAVSNTVNAVEDLKGVANIQDQVASIAKNAADAITKIPSNITDAAGNLKKEAFEALGTVTNEYSKALSTYAYSFDSALNQFSEIKSSKDFSLSKEEQKNPDILKNILDQDHSIPSMPGNLFYSAVGDKFENHNPDLYSKFQEARNNPANSEKSDSDLVLDFFPDYAVPGYNSLDADLKFRLGQLQSLSNISGSPDEDLLDLIAVLGLRNKTDYQRFENIKKLDSYLSKITTTNAYRAISLFTQAEIPISHPGGWLFQLKILTSTSGSVGDMLNLLFVGRLATGTDTPFDRTANWVFNQQISENVYLGYPIDLQIQTDPAFAEEVRLSREYVSTYLIPTRDNFPGGKSILTAWKDSLSSIGGPLGYQSIILLICYTCLKRIKIMSLSLNPDEEKIKKLCLQGKRFAAYLFNGAELKKAFDVLGETN